MAVPEHLETLASLDLTMREAEHSELAYLFRHEITREVAYDLLTESQSRQLHRAVAEWHERTYTEDELAPHYALLAHHWARADDPDKAVTYLERAGRQALRSGAFSEALIFLDRRARGRGRHAGPDPRRHVPEGPRHRALLHRRLRAQPGVPRAGACRAARDGVPVDAPRTSRGRWRARPPCRRRI